jgi:hypothetical protein
MPEVASGPSCRIVLEAGETDGILTYDEQHPPFCFAVCPLGARICLVVRGTGAPRVLAAGSPTISSFSPKSGPVGSTVEIEGTNFIPRLSISFFGDVQAEGSFTGTTITVTVPDGASTGPIQVQTANGTAETPQSFVVGATKTPHVTLEATVPEVMLGSGKAGEFTLKLSEESGEATVIKLRIVGSAQDGTDYKLLLDTAKVMAGQKEKIIKVVPKGNLGGAAIKNVRLTVLPGDGYEVGNPATAKVKIEAGK